MAKPFETRRIPLFYGGTLVGAAAMYGFRFLLARALSPEAYGTFFSLIAFITTLSLLNDLGFNSAFTYYFTKSKHHHSDVFTLTLLVRTALATILFLFTALGSSFIAKSFFHAPNLTHPILFFSIFFYVEELLQLLLSYHAATNHYVRFSLAIPCARLALFTLSLLATLLLSKTELLTAYVVIWVLSLAVTIPALAWRVPFRKLLTPRPSYALFKPLTLFALATALGGLGGVILGKFDTLFLTYFRGSLEVGYYEVAVPLTLLFLTLITPLNSFLGPSLMQYHHAGRQGELSRLFLLIQRVLLFLLLPFSLFLALFAKEVIMVLFGKSYTPAAPALVILALAVFFQAFSNFNTLFLSATGRLKETNIVLWGGALLNIILNLFFIPRFGFVAAAWTTLTAYILMFVTGLFFLAHQFRIVVPWRSWAVTALIGLIALLAAFTAKKLFSLPLYVKAAVIGTLFLSLYYALGLLLKVTTLRELREYLAALLPKPLLRRFNFRKA